MKHNNSDKLGKLKSKALFVFVGGVVVVNPAFAQDATVGTDDAQTLGTVEVTGLRNSLETSMNIKRDANGIVDAISAEDIGKFPDTNLAEALQRITGISIERRDGEGAQVTVRGFGPEFNMVTLNGRQIPGAEGFSNGDQVTGGVGSGTRAFNFAQLSADAISGVEVYKTGRANAPAGGIGATIDIQTARPLDRNGLVASAGAKLLKDESQTLGSDVTPELTGIFSYANPDKTFGIGINGSYQKRHGGDVEATENAWNIRTWPDSGIPSQLGSGTVVTNAPQSGQLYAIPNDLRYAFSDFERERVNGQAVMQFRPMDSLTLTLDYTYSTNKIKQNRGEQTMWLNQGGGFTAIEFDTSTPIAVPVYLREVTGSKDFGYEQQLNQQKYKLGSLGFNAAWDVNDRFKMKFDAHDSKNKSLPNDPITGGSATFFSLAGTNADSPPRNCTGPYCGGNWSQEFFFNNGLPIATRTWYPNLSDANNNTGGTVNPNFPPGQLGSQVRRIWMTSQTSEVKQGRLDGEWDFDNSRFKFGLDSMKTTLNRQNSNDSYAALGDWGVSNVGNEPGMVALLKPIGIAGLFNDYSTTGIAPSAWWGNASALAAWAASAYGVPLTYDHNLANNNRIEEKTNAAYLQYEWQGELAGKPVSLVAGGRYEKTDVASTSIISIPQAVVWQDDNDFNITQSSAVQPFSEKTSYNYFLPNLDLSLNFTDDMKGRASASRTIARAPMSNLYAGPTPKAPTGSVLVADSMRGSGDSQNPALKPLQSDNLDLAFEWYFAKSSYASLTLWGKRVDNFVGNTVVQESLYGLRDPTSGPDAQKVLDFLRSPACIAQVTAAHNDPARCSANNVALFTGLAMLRNAAATGGLANFNGSDAQWQQMATAYDLVGNTDDPLYLFNVNRPINQHKATLHGFELGWQYFFGDSGFGVQANYTKVLGDVSVNNYALPGVNQFALTGLSDTANAVLMYEKHGWSVRLAWNWRDKYLIAANQEGSNTNPYYVEPYHQVDLSVNYALNDRWSFSFETINLTGEDVRWSNRTKLMVDKLLDQSPRYLIGAHYKF